MYFLSGCASKNSLSTYNELFSSKNIVDGKAAPTISSKRIAELEKAYQNAMDECDTEMNSLNKISSKSRNIEVILASVGIAAGSIIVPALAAKEAAASAIAGWGGMSGAANAAQYSLNQKGASAHANTTIYMGLRAEILKASLEYSSPAATEEKKVAAIKSLEVYCKFPPLPNVAEPQNPNI